MRDIFSLLKGDAAEVAPQILGWQLVRRIDGREVRVRIVEVEAYHQSDAASHSHNGRTPRTDVMFGPHGHLYVYFTYGMHYCCNIVTGLAGEGSAILIRAVEPLEGEDLLRERRHMASPDITNGPAKLCQALGIDKKLNGHDLHNEPLQLVPTEPLPPEKIVQTSRIGITKDTHRPWRFYIKDNPYVSHPHRKGV